MNLNNNPTMDELRNLVAGCDDGACSHIVWVEKNGDVHIEPNPEHILPKHWDDRPSLQFRLETLDRGNGYVGPDAANDEEWVERLFKGLVDNWARGTQGYCDQF